MYSDAKSTSLLHCTLHCGCTPTDTLSMSLADAILCDDDEHVERMCTQYSMSICICRRVSPEDA